MESKKRDYCFCEFCADRGIFPGGIVPVVKSLSRVIKSSSSVFINVIAATWRAKGACEAECYYGSSFNGPAELLAYQQRDTMTVSRNRSANNPRHVALRYIRVTYIKLYRGVFIFSIDNEISNKTDNF